MTATLQQTQMDLGPYFARLRGAIRRALERYQREIGAVAANHSKRSQASLVHDYMVAEVKGEFDGEPGVAYATRQNLFTITFFNKYRIKLKKHDRNLRTSNVPTQLVLDWLSQKQLELPEMPEATTNLHLGYQPGMTLQSSKIWLTCPDGSSLDWKLELVDEEPLDLPNLDIGPRPQPVRPRPTMPVAPAVESTDEDTPSDR